MNRTLRLFLAALLLVGVLVSASCSSRAPASPAVAKVNGVTLTQADLDREMRHTTAYYQAQYNIDLNDPTNASLVPKARDEALQRIIDQELIRQLATGAFPKDAPLEPIVITDEEVQARVAQYESQAQDQATLLAQNGFESYKEFLNFVRGELQVEKLYEKYGQGEQVHARHILVATEEEARQVLARLKNGEDFAAVAQELSIDTSSGKAGGDLGWFGRNQKVAEFEQAAYALEVNQLSEPVQTKFGWHIIEVLEKGMKADNQAFQTWFEGMRGQAQIDVVGQ